MDINIVKLMALAVLVLPLFALPFIMKAAGGILERFGLWTNNRSRGFIDRSRNMAQEKFGRTRYARARDARKAERYRRQDEKFASDMSEDSKRGRVRRAMYGGMRFTDGQKADSKAAWDNIYDENRERIAKNTERTRGRATDAGAFTASSAYALRNETTGQMEAVDKDRWMYEMYTNKDATGTVTSLDGKTTHFNASDNSFNSAVASQAAKSGDKAMYGKLLDRATEMREEGERTGDEALKNRGAELEFKLRDFGVNNAGVVAGGHPDVVKGKYSAFKSISAEGLLAMDGSAVRRMGEYLSSGENVYEDLRVGMEAKVRTENPALSQDQIEKEASQRLGRTIGQDGKIKYEAGGDIERYLTTAQNAFKEAVVQLNTKDIYSGKAVEGGDLDKAVVDAGIKMGMNPNKDQATVRFGDRGVRSSAGNASAAQAVPSINLSTPTPSGTSYPLPAQQITAQVQQVGGWAKLDSKDVMDIYNHANTLPNNTDSAQLGSEALDELRNRGILPPASGNTP